MGFVTTMSSNSCLQAPERTYKQESVLADIDVKMVGSLHSEHEIEGFPQSSCTSRRAPLKGERYGALQRKCPRGR